jgi:prepilin-type processing-associated H-X9-DG protein
MSDENLIGYLLDLLDPDDRVAVITHVADHPEAAARLDQLRRAIEPLAADLEPVPVPPGLAIRTVARLAEHLVATEPRTIPPGPSAIGELLKVLADPTPSDASHPDDGLSTLRKAPPERPESRVLGGRFRADLIVAAGIGLIAVGLVLSGVNRARQQSNLLTCQNNLRTLHNGLAGYADKHDGRFPQVGVDPYPTAGAFVSALVDDGQFPPGFTPICPAAGTDGPPARYTYTLGHLAPGGGVLGLRRSGDPAEQNDLLPIAADCPAAGIAPGVGPVCQHGNVMNVLYVGGNVRGTTVATVGPNGDDIYRNRFGLVSAGVDRVDAVLGRTDDRP